MIDIASNMRPVRDQGRRGTCVAFAATAVHEHARTVRRGPLEDELCVEHLFWRAKQLDGNLSDGTTFTSARDTLTNSGQCDERHWPYVPVRDLTAPYDPPTAVAAAPAARATIVPLTADLASITDILAEGRPVICGMQLWDGFFSCASAQLASPAGDVDPTARHAVCLTGLDGGAVQIRNSWGPGWGQAGYAWTDLRALMAVLLEAWTLADDVDPD